MLRSLLIEAATVDTGLAAGIILVQLLLQFGIGGLFGFGFGYLGVWLAQAYRRIGGTAAEDSGQTTAMISILAVATVFLTFTAATLLEGNGYLAVYICGIYSEIHGSLSRKASAASWTG